MKLPPRRLYEFSSYRVDVAERRLWRDGELVPLTPKVFDILLALVENAGRTVDKEQLMDRVWANTFVEEGNLNRHISTLRKTLGDDSQRQDFIKTIPKRGYRFTSEVREIIDEEKEILLEDRTRVQMKLSEEIRENQGFTGIPKPYLVFIAVLLVASVSVLMWNRAESDRASGVVVGESDKREALEMYKKGRAFWKTRDGTDLHKATRLLEQAVAKDPNLARAHAALGDAYAFDSRLWQKAEPSAREAIRLDPELGEPHATLGLVKMMWEWKFREAEKDFKESIRLNPNYATARQWYAINLHALGYAGHAAVTEMEKALELEPLSVSINADMCQTLYFLRRNDEAIAQCKKTLKIDPKSHNAHQYLYEIYSTTGKNAEAVEMYFRLDGITLSPLTPEFRKKIRLAFEKGGIQAFREEVVNFMLSRRPRHYRIARTYAWMGDADKTFIHLRKAFEDRDFDMFLFLSDPAFEKFRGDHRYIELSDSLLPKRVSNPR